MSSNSRLGREPAVIAGNNVSLQRSAADFIANYHSKQPHADVATLDKLFAEVPPKKNRGSDYEELPVSITYENVPVHLIRAGATIADKKKKDFDPILDTATGDTYYLFLGDERLEAFAQLADNSSEWATFTIDGACETLSTENQKIVTEILAQADLEVRAAVRARNHEAEEKHRRRVAVAGFIAAIGIIGGAAAGVYEFFHIRSEKAIEAIDTYDAQWGAQNLSSMPVVASDHTVHDVPVVPFNQYLANAPSFDDSSKTGVPRSEKVELATGGCSYATIALDASDTVTAVQLKYSEVDPIGMVVDDVNDRITFCSFGGSSTQKNPVYTSVIFEITKQESKK